MLVLLWRLGCSLCFPLLLLARLLLLRMGQEPCRHCLDWCADVLVLLLLVPIGLNSQWCFLLLPLLLTVGLGPYRFFLRLLLLTMGLHHKGHSLLLLLLLLSELLLVVLHRKLYFLLLLLPLKVGMFHKRCVLLLLLLPLVLTTGLIQQFCLLLPVVLLLLLLMLWLLHHLQLLPAQFEACTPPNFPKQPEPAARGPAGCSCTTSKQAEQ